MKIILNYYSAQVDNHKRSCIICWVILIERFTLASVPHWKCSFSARDSTIRVPIVLDPVAFIAVVLLMIGASYWIASLTNFAQIYTDISLVVGIFVLSSLILTVGQCNSKFLPRNRQTWSSPSQMTHTVDMASAICVIHHPGLRFYFGGLCFSHLSFVGNPGWLASQRRDQGAYRPYLWYPLPMLSSNLSTYCYSASF